MILGVVELIKILLRDVCVYLKQRIEDILVVLKEVRVDNLCQFKIRKEVSVKLEDFFKRVDALEKHRPVFNYYIKSLACHLLIGSGLLSIA